MSNKKKQNELLLKIKQPKMVAAIAVCMVLIIISIVFAIKENSSVPEEESTTIASNSDTSYIQADNMLDMETVGKDTWDILVDIYKYMNASDYENLADLILNSYDELYDFWFSTCSETPYVFNGNVLVKADSIMNLSGIVVTGPETVFSGAFIDGLPSGYMNVISAYETDAKRFDFARGIFKDGYMDGKGETGYCYYDGQPNGNITSVSKDGEYVRDLMNGDFIYTVINNSENKISWNMTAVNGQTNVEDWDYNSDDQVYRLTSNEDNTQQYEIAAEDIHEERWRNTLVWPR